MRYAFSIALLVVLIGCGDKTAHSPERLDTLAVTGALEPIAPRDTIRLRYAPTAGTVLVCSMRQDDAFDSDSLHGRTRTELFFTETIERIAPTGHIELRMRYDSVTIEQRDWERDSSQAKTMRYRSTDSSSDDPRLEIFKAAIGEEIRATIAPNGTVEEIGGVGAIVRKLLGSHADSLAIEQRQIIDQQLKSELYGYVLVQQFLLLPDAPLDSSRAWTRTAEQELSSVFAATTTARYRLQGIQRRGDDSLLVIAATLDGSIHLVPGAAKMPITIRTGTVRGSASSVLSRRYGVMLRRSNTSEYELMVEATDRSGVRQRARQWKRSSSDFAVRWVRSTTGAR